MLFKTNVKYVFDKSKFIKLHEYDYAEDEAVRSWVEKCDGKEVKIIHEHKGVVDDYDVVPSWCKQVRKK